MNTRRQPGHAIPVQWSCGSLQDYNKGLQWRGYFSFEQCDALPCSGSSTTRIIIKASRVLTMVSKAAAIHQSGPPTLARDSSVRATRIPYKIISFATQMEAKRFDVMDAQRFDISKRRSPRSTLNVAVHATIGHGQPSHVASPPPPSNSPASSIRAPRKHHTLVIPPLQFEPFSASIEGDPDASSSSNPSDSPTSFSSRTIPSSQTSVSSVSLEENAKTNESHQIDTFVKDEFTTTCTIIRPVPRSPLVGCLCLPLSRPSSPFSRPSSPIPRSTSPLDITLNALNCFGSTDAFEEDLDYIQSQRSKELAGHAAVKVLVTQETTVHTEELWREAVQEVLYGSRNGGGMHRRAGSGGWHAASV